MHPILPHFANHPLLRPGLAQTWWPLQVFNVYRMLLALIMAGLFFSEMGPSFLGRHDPSLFAMVSVVYLIVGFSGFWSIHRKRPDFATQTTALVFTDIVALTLMMHASGGVTTGLGMLLAVSVAAGSLLLPEANPLLFAAVGSLCILGEQLYADFNNQFPSTAYTQAGILGVMLFSSALLAMVLSQRARRSEALASRRGVDLANMERLNEHIIQHLQAGLLVVDARHRIRLMNNSAWFLLGLPASVEGEALGQISSRLHDQLAAWQRDRKSEPKPFRLEMNGAELIPRFTMLGNDTETGTLILLDDQARMSQQAQQLKLASLGRLTASIAHEIRNPLGALSHAAQLLGETPGLGRAEERLVEIIDTHTRRMNEIVESVLQLSRRDAAHPETLPLRPWLEEFINEFVELHNLAAKQVSLAISPPATEILADDGQLRQILNNICENSLRYGRSAGGRYHLSLQGGLSREIRGPFLDVVDEGPGILPDLVPQLFEPFFTTDRRGGTGLGLYIARELAENNRARLEYIPVPTGGSCFRIIFADPREQTF